MITLTIDGKRVESHPESTVLEAALEAGIYIPNLCYHPDLPPIGACRLCIVNISGMKGTPASCTTRVAEGMDVKTCTEEVVKKRKNIIWLTLSELNGKIKESSQLHKVADWVGREDILKGYNPESRKITVKRDDPLFVRDMNKCILCGRCVRMCRDVRKAGVLGLAGRGIKTVVDTSYSKSLKSADCRFCLACVEVCPSGALEDKKEFSPPDREKVLVPCTGRCPAGIDAARYVKLIAEEKYVESLEVIRERVPFPEILGYVCDHPCEKECRRGDVNQPIAIRALKRFAAEKGGEGWKDKIKVSPGTGRKVAVVGSGPAGLTAAWFLNRLGHSVAVFESAEKPGGMMRAGIPAYRLPRKVLDREISVIESFGVEIKTGIRIKGPEELFNKGFDALFLATGAWEGMSMSIEGEDDERVLQGVEVLNRISSQGYKLKGEVGVVGGGNVAIDVARSALRSGAEKVTLLYRRSREQMPALKEEVEEALEEGVRFSFLSSPRKVISAEDKLKVECIKMELGEPDSSGRRRPVPVEGSEYIFEADRLVMAIGQRPTVPEGFSSLKNDWGGIRVREDTMETSIEGVFAGGDAVEGPASVIKAIRDGRKGASSIDRYLGGTGEIDIVIAPEDEPRPCLGREEGFSEKERRQPDTVEAKERIGSFCPAEKSYPENLAVSEADRCLRCALRLNISPAPAVPCREK